MDLFGNKLALATAKFCQNDNEQYAALCHLGGEPYLSWMVDSGRFMDSESTSRLKETLWRTFGIPTPCVDQCKLPEEIDGITAAQQPSKVYGWGPVCSACVLQQFLSKEDKLGLPMLVQILGEGLKVKAAAPNALYKIYDEYVDVTAANLKAHPAYGSCMESGDKPDDFSDAPQD